MVLTHLDIFISNPTNPKRGEKLEFLIDSGAMYSVAPTKVLKKLDIRPDDEREFILANGQKIKRRLGIARFEYNGCKGGAPVIFGKRGDSTLLGATTLEAMGLALNPFKRDLIRLPMVF